MVGTGIALDFAFKNGAIATFGALCTGSLSFFGSFYWSGLLPSHTAGWQIVHFNLARRFRRNAGDVVAREGDVAARERELSGIEEIEMSDIFSSKSYDD